MKINDAGLEIIKNCEKCKLTAYKALPSEKDFTIGWGHMGSDVTEGMKITQAAADELLKKDLEKFENYVTHYAKKYALELNLNQFSALVSFTYNCGPKNLDKLLKGRNILQVADKMLDFNHANGKVYSGLTKRRQRERGLFMREDMKIIIGSARIDENGKAVGGAAGDQKQKSNPDYSGEVSLQEFYVSSKGWYILRPKDPAIAQDIAGLMRVACNNPCIGYDQAQRLEILKVGVFTQTKTECDCSSLMRMIIMEASGMDPGNFITSNEADKLEATGLFEKRVKYTSGMKIYEGDVLITCSKGHTAAVVEGYKRELSLAKNDIKKSGIKLEITMPLIKKGSKGLAVMIWQQMIGRTYLSTEFNDDLVTDTKTWQQAHGLKVDGIVGENSWTEGFKQV